MLYHSGSNFRTPGYTFPPWLNKWWMFAVMQLCPLVCGRYQSLCAPSSNILCPNNQLQSINSEGTESISRLKVTYWKRLKESPHYISYGLKPWTLSLPKSEWQKVYCCCGWMSKAGEWARAKHTVCVCVCVCTLYLCLEMCTLFYKNSSIFFFNS